MPVRVFRILLTVLLCTGLAISSRAQGSILNKTVSVNFRKTTIPEMLKVLEQKTGAAFSYNHSIIPTDRYSLFAKDETLNEVLIAMFSRHKLVFSVLYGNVIIINKASEEKKLITVSGYVYDDSTGEKMVGANVFNFLTMKGTSTNEDGFYSLTLEKDSIWLVASYVGYKPRIEKFYLDWHRRVNLRLTSASELPGVKVSGKQTAATPQVLPGEFRVPMQKLKHIPVLFGESDIIKLLQLLPGVQAGNEGTTGLYVRGGGPDQNLILLDDVPVYNASHLYGFFSIFNSDVVKNTRLIKGGFPARYGGRLSSVLDIRTIDGNTSRIRTELSLGLVSSKATVEGPMSKKTTFVLSGRRSYFDLLGGLVNDDDNRSINSRNFSSNYYFYDINAKVNYKFSEKHSLSLSFYNGNDRSYIVNSFSLKDPVTTVKEKDKQVIFWGNTIVSMRYSRLINKKVFGQATLAFSNYRFGNRSEYAYQRSSDSGKTENTFEYRFLSEIQDISLITDVDYRPAQFWSIRMGGNGIIHRFRPGISTYSSSYAANASGSYNNKTVLAAEINTYIENDVNISRKLTANVGLHHTFFGVENTFTQGLQPRLTARYRIINHLSLNASYAAMQQFMHLLTNATVGLPMDLWLPSTAKIRPESSNITSLSLIYNPKHWLYSIEVFNKNMNNVLEYKEQANYIGNTNNWEDKVEAGRGWAYGSEFMIEKKTGKTTGWVGYTLSWNYRQFDHINQGRVFPYRYDRRHDIGILVSHAFSERTDVVITWVYATGNSISLPTQRYLASSVSNPMQDIYIFGDRNGYTLPAYHRLDMVWNFKKYGKKLSRVWSIGAYNLYNRQNPFYITTGYDKNGMRTLKQVSIFPIIPSVNYKISF